MSEQWKRGSTRAWRRVRAAVLVRDGHRCQLRLPEVCTGRATHVHHTLGRAVTGDDPAHLVASCGPCNLTTGDPRAADPPPRPAAWWE
jgi:5-methylcytosine-specific restriction endonuclease McrA